MVLKRPFLEDGDDDLGVLVQRFKQRPTFKNVVTHVMRGHSLKEIGRYLEPFIRTAVREELERVILPLMHQLQRPQHNQIETSTGRGLQLHFVKSLPSPIFTGSRIEADNGSPIQIELVDASTKTRITSGPLSSIRLEILVLDGDFGSDDQEDWTEQDFSASILREREGRRPLVTGDLTITLKEGVGCIGDVVFTDNSSWIRSRKFRLGVRIVQRVSGEVIIREGRSEAFIVKDHRGELYKKHYPPSAGDEIWRLAKIAKDGAFHKRLTQHGINTVKDFLRLYVTDPTKLRNILGGGISNRSWENITEHAMTCDLDRDEFYIYYEPQRGSLLFDSIYRVVGAFFDGQTYQPVDRLCLGQKILVEDLKRHAYKNLNDLVPSTRPFTNLQDEPFTGPNLLLQALDFPITNQDQREAQFGFELSPASTSYSYEAEADNQLELSVPQNNHPIQTSCPMDFFPIPYNGENCWCPNSSQGLIMPNAHFENEDVSVPQPHILSTWSPAPALWGQGNGLFFTSDNEPDLGIFSALPDFNVHISRIRGSKVRWLKIRAAVKMSLVWRHTAARRMVMETFC